MKVRLPRLYAVNKKVEKNWIRQIACLELEAEGDVVRFVTQGIEGFRVSVESLVEPIWVLRDAPRIMPAPSEAAVLKCSAMLTDDGLLDACNGSWLQHPLQPDATASSNEVNAKNATESWRGAFKYVLEDRTADIVGLRPPKPVHSTRSTHTGLSATRLPR